MPQPLSNAPAVKILKRDGKIFEQVVMGEVIIPDTPNVYGDIYTHEAVRDFCYEFARQGFGIDINHDQIDVQGTHAYIIESFIARAGDPDFIEGSWVIAMKIPDTETWQRVLDGDLNGYSFEALCTLQPIVFQNLRNRQVQGTTEPDPIDGHTHEYVVLLDIFNRPVAGGTVEAGGHSHTISTHTVTDYANTSLGRNHSHRYQTIVLEGEFP
jgi:hypothetical protein